MEVNFPIKSNASRISSTNNHRDNMKKESQDRKKNILHLIHKYFKDNNMLRAAELLENDVQIGANYQVCDNVDLEIILQEYQSYYYAKFQKHPKIIRKLDEKEQTIVSKEGKSVNKEKSKKLKEIEKSSDHLQFEILSLSKSSTSHVEIEPKLLTELENYADTEWREMANQIIKHILPKTSAVNFDNCIGLNQPIERLKEAIIYPLNYPQLFEKIYSWKGILLYGPPGTGKTLLAKASANQSTSTFINVTSSTFISKWRGESEKMLKVLFDVAKFYSPTTIFIDEIDALASTNQDSNHEASRRFKSELLTQIDGVIPNENVFVLATTNNPWMIDNALLRRFEKRILVPLPDHNGRSAIFRHYVGENSKFNSEELQKLVDLTTNFSGSDIRTVCKEAEMILIREQLQQIKCGKFDNKKQVRKITVADVVKALEKIKPCIDNCDYKKYFEWGNKYGAI